MRSGGKVQKAGGGKGSGKAIYRTVHELKKASCTLGRKKILKNKRERVVRGRGAFQPDDLEQVPLSELPPGKVSKIHNHSDAKGTVV